MKLTKRQESIILGIVLGDGFLQKTGKLIFFCFCFLKEKNVGTMFFYEFFQLSFLFNRADAIHIPRDEVHSFQKSSDLTRGKRFSTISWQFYIMSMPRGKKKMPVQLFGEDGTLMGHMYVNNKQVNLEKIKEKIKAKKMLRYNPKTRKREPVQKLKEEKHST